MDGAQAPHHWLLQAVPHPGAQQLPDTCATRRARREWGGGRNRSHLAVHLLTASRHAWQGKKSGQAREEEDQDIFEPVPTTTQADQSGAKQWVFLLCVVCCCGCAWCVAVASPSVASLRWPVTALRTPGAAAGGGGGGGGGGAGGGGAAAAGGGGAGGRAPGAAAPPPPPPPEQPRLPACARRCAAAP